MILRLIILAITSGLLLAGCNAHRPAHSPRVQSHAGAPVPLRGTTSIDSTHAIAARNVAVRATNPDMPYRLGSGDKVRVTVFGQESLSRTYPIDASGYVSMPLIGAVAAGGRTTFDLEAEIAAALRVKYVKEPKVTVEVETHRPFFILGEVRKGGQFAYVPGMTVETAVAIAGGYTARARKRTVHLSRQVNGRIVIRKVPPTWKVMPGDTITVKERFL